MVKYYVAIDIGNFGGLCFRSSTGDFALHQMPIVKGQIDFKAVYNLLAFFKGKNVHVGFEKLRGIYGVSTKATWGLAEQVGHFKAFCIALRLPFTEIPPKEWQTEMFTGIKRVEKLSSTKKTMVHDTKISAYYAYLRLYPKLKVPKGARGKILDGQIDAALIAEFLIRKLK